MSLRIIKKEARRARRKQAIRHKVIGTSERPRLTVFKSSRHIYAQIINDVDGRTLVASSTMTQELKGSVKHGGNVAAAKQVGEHLADKAMSAGIKAVVFDRNGYRYHGRLKALADAARQKGLQF
jgi:large subunit ribosomal protein L18